MFGRKRQEIVISEPDIEAALEHLGTLPFRESLPASWDRKHLLNRIREEIGPQPKIDQCISVAPGIFAIIKPFGVDLASSGEADGRLQVWLAIRIAGTDPSRTSRL